jgi:hypothetical protein
MELNLLSVSHMCQEQVKKSLAPSWLQHSLLGVKEKVNEN